MAITTDLKPTDPKVISSLPDRIGLYADLQFDLEKLPEDKRISRLQTLYRIDLFALIRYGMRRTDFENQWLLERCREVQAEPNDVLNLWARDHRKSTIITMGHSMFDIIRDPETTIGIFSHTRPIAKGFLRLLKREMEGNDHLKKVYPDIFWDNPKKDAPKWSEDDGLVVKRKSNPVESTVEAWGLVDGQPTGKHFVLIVYDDIVVQSSVTTPEMIAKTTKAWELSRNLLRSEIEGSTEESYSRYAGTRYHFNDTWGEIIRRKVVNTVTHPCTEDGTVDGKGVLLPREIIEEKRREMGPYVFSCQMLLNPVEDEAQGFRYDWVRYYNKSGKPQESYDYFNKYLLVDPASGKRPTNDYTSMGVIGLGPDGKYYLLDLIRDRLNLTQRTDALFDLHMRWNPQTVGYEKYGMQSDIEFIELEMNRINYNFDIIPLAGPTHKNDRIRRLIPIFEQGRFYLPDTLPYTDYQGKYQDLVQIFINEEYKPFPVPVHDDCFDMMARIMDAELQTAFPQAGQLVKRNGDRYAQKGKGYTASEGSWMTR
jgi:phage terminase large subunit-like protein